MAVSVIVPAYQAERYLAECIASVLAQTVPVHEVVVVDDGSSDATAAIAASFGDPVRVVRQGHAGANPARNRGVRASSGDLIAFLDADDRWTPGKLGAQLAALGADPWPEIVFGLVTQFHSPEISDPVVHLPAGAQGPVIGHHLGAMLLTRETFDAVGWLDETNCYGDFVDWFARALDQGRRIAVVDEVVMERRLHLHNKGRQHDSGPEQYARAIRKVLDRRRVTGRTGRTGGPATRFAEPGSAPSIGIRSN